MNCKQCNTEMSPSETMLSLKHEVCGKCTRKNHKKAVKKLNKDNPSVPSDVYDIEASQEVANMYLDMFGVD